MNLNLFQFWKKKKKLQRWGLPCVKKAKRQVEKDEDLSYSQKLSPRAGKVPSRRRQAAPEEGSQAEPV